MAYTLQLKRHVNYENKDAALAGLQAYLATAAVGEPAIATYGRSSGSADIENDKVLFGIKGSKGYTIFDYEAIPADVKDALDAIKGNGYDKDGTYATLKAIADALTIINGADTVEGSIAKAKQDAKDYADTQIDATVKALDVTDAAVAKSFVTEVSETDGKIAVKRGAITSKGGTIALTDGKDGGINIDVVSTALTINGKDAIKVAESGTGREISLAISKNDKVLSQTTDGLLATFAIAKLGSANEGMAASYQLQDKAGNPMGVTIDIPKDMVISAAEVKKVEQADRPYSGAVVGDMYIDFTIANATSDHIYLPAKTLFDAYVQGNGIQINGNKIAVKLDRTGENFLTVDANGIKLSGVQTAINTAKAELLGDAATEYNTLGKLEDKIQALDVKASAAHTEVVAKTDGHVRVAVANSTDGTHKVVTVTEDDIASANALTAEINRAKKAEDKVESSVGLAADGSHVTATGNYTSGATTVVGEIAALDTQVKTNAVAIAAETSRATAEETRIAKTVIGEGELPKGQSVMRVILENEKTAQQAIKQLAKAAGVLSDEQIKYTAPTISGEFSSTTSIMDMLNKIDEKWNAIDCGEY